MRDVYKKMSFPTELRVIKLAPPDCFMAGRNAEVRRAFVLIKIYGCEFRAFFSTVITRKTRDLSGLLLKLELSR